MDETITHRLDDVEFAKGVRVDAVERLDFSVAGKHYQVDLGDQSLKDFATALEPFIAVARQVNTKGESATGRRRKSTDQGSRNNAHEVRKWAIEHGHELSDRGRIPGHVRQAYLDHRASATEA